jgi:hypothetical protein
LLAVLVQVVKDLEEDFLGTLFFSKELNIVNNQHIEVLVKVDELIVIALLGRVDKLIDEFLSTDKHNHFLLVGLFDQVSDGVGEVGFAQSATTKNHQRVKSGSTGFLRNGQSGVSCQFVAIAFYEIVEGVAGIQLAINVHSLQTRDDEWVFDGGVHVDGHSQLILY